MRRAEGDIVEAKRMCLCCGRTIVVNPTAKEKKDKNLSAGMKSTSSVFKQYECIPWCMDCLRDMYKVQYNIYHDYYIAMFYLCKMIDFPYIESMVDVDTGKGEIEDIFTYYFKTARWRDAGKIQQGFMGGVYLSEREMPLMVDAEVLGDDVAEYTYTKSDSMQGLFEKWGRNKRYSPDDYVDLEAIYHSIANQNGIITDPDTGEVVDKVTEIAVIEAAANLLQSRKCRNRGDAEDAKKYYDLYDKAMGSQLLRGKDLKDKQVGDVLIQDIVKYCESDGFIEPWDKKIKYPHKKDVVDQVLLHIMNYVGRLTADIFNKHVERLNKIPKEYMLKGRNDEFPDEETDFDKLYKKALVDIADFKATQHISDDDGDEDSADLDADTDSDASLLGVVD